MKRSLAYQESIMGEIKIYSSAHLHSQGKVQRCRPKQPAIYTTAKMKQHIFEEKQPLVLQFFTHVKSRGCCFDKDDMRHLICSSEGLIERRENMVSPVLIEF